MKLSPMFARFLVALAFVAGVVGVLRLVDSFAIDELYRKDFMQEYVLAKAVVDGENIYAGLPELVGKYFSPAPEIRFEHPTPHTPVAAVLSVPIGWFPYSTAAAVWMGVELVCLGVVLELLVRWWGCPVAVWQRGVLFLMCLGFGPVIRELWCGQFSLVMLVLMLLAWLLLRTNRDLAGGAILGLALALKLFVWPIGLYLLICRWRAALAAGIVAIAANVAAVPVVGWDAIVDYYTRVGPLVARQHRENDENFSLWTVGPRLFSEAPQPEIASTFIAPPPLPSALMERIAAAGLPIIVLIGALALAFRCRQFDSAFAILLCASLPLNPVAWDHYLLLTAIPIAIVCRRLAAAEFPKGMTLAAAVAALITIVPNPAYLKWSAHAFAIGRAEPYAIVPFAAGLITFLPLVPLAVWIAILLRTDHRAEEKGRLGLNRHDSAEKATG